MRGLVRKYFILLDLCYQTSSPDWSLLYHISDLKLSDLNRISLLCLPLPDVFCSSKVTHHVATCLLTDVFCSLWVTHHVPRVCPK